MSLLQCSPIFDFSSVSYAENSSLFKKSLCESCSFLLAIVSFVSHLSPFLSLSLSQQFPSSPLSASLSFASLSRCQHPLPLVFYQSVSHYPSFIRRYITRFEEKKSLSLSSINIHRYLRLSYFPIDHYTHHCHHNHKKTAFSFFIQLAINRPFHSLSNFQL